MAGLKRGHVHSFILDPAPATMTPGSRRSLPALLNGVTAFLPSEEEMRNLFQSETHDLWEMAEAVALYGCETVVIKCGRHGQLLYNAATKQKWEIPAYTARVENPAGAGDAFGGGFVAGFCKNYDPLDGVLYGNVSASLNLEGFGAFHPLDVMPGLAEARLTALRDLVRKV
jgi:ribokinase